MRNNSHADRIGDWWSTTNATHTQKENKQIVTRVEFPASSVLTYNKKHWSIEKETLNLIQNIICPYIKDAKKKLGLYVSQKSLLLWDAFKLLSLDLLSAKLADAWGIFFAVFWFNHEWRYEKDAKYVSSVCLMFVLQIVLVDKCS